MRTAYWHKIPKQDQEAIIEFGMVTVGEFMAKYKQPPWCAYPGALQGWMGCWSLISPGWVTNEAYCQKTDCPLHRKDTT